MKCVVAACQRLKNAGYLIALDDFEMNDPREPLIDLADIIKLDVKSFSAANARLLMKRYAGRGCRMLAKKVETHGRICRRPEGRLRVFPGLFLSQAGVADNGARCPPIASATCACCRLPRAPDFDASARSRKAVKSDASFCYRLLRYLNSASFGFSNEIHSVRHAISMLGESEFRRWVRMVATLGASDGKCSDAAALRGWCERDSAN